MPPQMRCKFWINNLGLHLLAGQLHSDDQARYGISPSPADPDPLKATQPQMATEFFETYFKHFLDTYRRYHHDQVSRAPRLRCEEAIRRDPGRTAPQERTRPRNLPAAWCRHWPGNASSEEASSSATRWFACTLGRERILYKH